jgi:hypothetical protein
VNSNATTRVLRLEAEFRKDLRHELIDVDLDTKPSVQLRDASVDRCAQRGELRRLLVVLGGEDLNLRPSGYEAKIGPFG